VAQSLDSAIILIVVGTTIIIGFAGYRLSKTFMGYIFANKTLGPWLLAFSIMATYFSAASFLGGGGATYLYNLGFGAWLTAWHVIGVVILWIVVAKRLFRYASEYKVMSIPEFIEHRYRSRLARVIAVVIMIFLFIFYLVSVYKGGAIIISTMLGIDIQLALLILAIPVIIYIVIGGLRAAAINNLFLGLLMLIAAAFTFSYIMSYVGGPIKGLEMLTQINILGKYPGMLWLKLNGMGPSPVVERNMVVPLIMGITFSIGMAQIALPNLLIQFYAARDSKAISRGRVIGPILVALYAMLMFSLGAFCHIILDSKIPPNEVAQLMKDTDWVIPKTILMLAPIGIRGLILAAPVAASMSTIALTALTLSTTMTRDIIQLISKVNNDKMLLYIAKSSAAIFALIPMMLATIENRLIVEIVGAAFGTIFACFLGPITIGLYWKKASKIGAVASMVIGVSIGILWYLYLYRTTWIYPTIPATILALATYILLSLVKKPAKNFNPN